MFVEGGSYAPGKPPAPRRPPLTPRQERIVLWVIAANALILLIAPVGGSTVVHAVLALLKHI